MKTKTLISVVGPTAVGKTAFSIRLAKEHRAPIISADSVQMYRGLDIGSGKITAAEKDGVQHYLIDVLDPNEEFSAGKFGREVENLLGKLFLAHDTVLLVGGSGFYFQAVWEGFDEMPKIDPDVRTTLNAEFTATGLEPLQAELERVDPVTWAAIDQRNHARIIRALEIWRTCGEPISAFRGKAMAPVKPYIEVRLGLEMERQALYRRIEARVDLMMAAGWLAEARQVGEVWGLDCKALQSLGYRELVAHIKGETTLAEAVELIKRNTRRFSKRQMTWFRRFEGIEWRGGE